MLVYGTICAHMRKLCSLYLVTTKLALAMQLGSSSLSASQTIIDARAQARVGPGLVMLLVYSMLYVFFTQRNALLMCDRCLFCWNVFLL